MRRDATHLSCLFTYSLPTEAHFISISFSISKGGCLSPSFPHLDNNPKTHRLFSRWESWTPSHRQSIDDLPKATLLLRLELEFGPNSFGGLMSSVTFTCPPQRLTMVPGAWTTHLNMRVIILYQQQMEAFYLVWLGQVIDWLIKKFVLGNHKTEYI